MNDFFQADLGNETKRKRLKAQVIASGYLWNDEFDCAEHRVVALKARRHLLSVTDEVHHIDHDKRNNDPSNLIVLQALTHYVIHILSPYMRWSADHKFELKKADQLIDFLKEARIEYDYILDHSRF
jgi:hypothetical protein